MTTIEELLSLADDAAHAKADLLQESIQEPLKVLGKACKEIARAWSGSNLGYHSTVYYRNFEPKPPYVQFSIEHGLEDRWPAYEVDSGWEAMDFQAVFDEIIRRSGGHDPEELNSAIHLIREKFLSIKESVISIIVAYSGSASDAFLERMRQNIEKLQAQSGLVIAQNMVPQGQIISSDYRAMEQGLKIAPHQVLGAVQKQAVMLDSSIDTLEKNIRQTVAHIERLDQKRPSVSGTPTSEKDVWISARDALSMFGKRTYGRGKTICTRAHAGMIRARAARFIRDGKASDNIDVPIEFWWAKGEQALKQNWDTGDFETWINHTVLLQAFGVTFLRSEIEQAIPAPTLEERQNKMTTNRTKIFIGHGRSPMWRELKDYLHDQLNLDVDEFNSISVAGITTVDRLAEMLKVAAFAFLIMTAEDEQPDGKFNPRMNVIHEAGLFQGRLGFKKAIILLEEGCEEFSNKHGLGDIRFPQGHISAKFHEIHAVLKREKIVT